MREISHIVPTAENVYLENVKIVFYAKSECFRTSATYKITGNNKYTHTDIPLQNIKVINFHSLEAIFPKLTETGIYTFTIHCDENRPIVESGEPAQPRQLESKAFAGILAAFTQSNNLTNNITFEAETDHHTEDESDVIVCNHEFTWYPSIQSDAMTIVTSCEGGETIHIYGNGFSSSAKLMIGDNELVTQFVSEKQLTAILPAFDSHSQVNIGVKSNGAVVLSNINYTYKLPECNHISTNKIAINSSQAIDMIGSYFLKNETAIMMKVMLNDIPCKNVNVNDDKQLSFVLPELPCANIYRCAIACGDYRSASVVLEVTPVIEKLSETSIVLKEMSNKTLKIMGFGFHTNIEVFFGSHKCECLEITSQIVTVQLSEEIKFIGNYQIYARVNGLMSNEIECKITNHKIVSVQEKDAQLYIHGIGLDGDLTVYIGSEKIQIQNNESDKTVIIERQSLNLFGRVEIYIVKLYTESNTLTHIMQSQLLNRENICLYTASKNEKLRLQYQGKYSGTNLYIMVDLPPKDETCDRRCMKIVKYEAIYENDTTIVVFDMPEIEHPCSNLEASVYIENVRFDTVTFHYLPKIELVYPSIIQWNEECVIEIVGENIPLQGKIIDGDKMQAFLIMDEPESAKTIRVPSFTISGPKSIGIMFDKYPNISIPASMYVLPQVSATECVVADKMVVLGRGFCENLVYRATLRGQEIEYVVNSESRCEIKTDQFSHDKPNHICLYVDEHLFFDGVVQYPERLTMITPNYGICSRSQYVMVDGCGFSKQTKVVFGAKTIEDVDFISHSQIKINLPECATHATHSIYTINDKDQKSINTLVYTSIPELTRLSMGCGSCLGKNEITIYGKGFVEMEHVKLIWDEKEIEYAVVDNNSLLIIVPPKQINSSIKMVLQTEHGFNTNALSYDYLPHLEKMSEYNGYMHGGKTISIYGYGFTTHMKVLWNNTYIDSNVISESELSVVVPKSNDTKTIDVSVEYNHHKSKQILTFTYIPHTISSIYPNEGSVKGNYEVKIQGDGLFTDEEIYVVVGGAMIPKNDFVFYDKNTIRFLMPEAASAGKNTIDVIMHNIKADKSLDFEYISRITSLSQNAIQVNAKNPLIVYGEGFSGCSIVQMGTYTIQNINYDAKTGAIHFFTPIIEHMQKMTIQVITNHMISNEVVIYVKPIIKNILPNPWIAEDSGFLYVSGEGFQDNVVACIMGLKSPSIIKPLKTTPTNVTFVLPYVKQCGEIIMAIGLLDIAENMWIVHKINVQPKIIRLSESCGPVIGNNKIEIIGKGFHPRCKIQICDSVTFFQPSRIEFVSENSIIVTMPSAEQVEKIRFMLWCNEIPSNSVEYNYCPYIKSIKPNYASINGGVTVMVDGEGFNADSVVLLNKLQIEKENTLFDAITRNLKVIIPKHFEVENMALKVVSNECESMNSIKFFYTPFLDSVSITNTSVTKQEIIKLYGNGFSKNTSVKIGDKIVNKKNILKIFDNVMEIKLPVIDEQSILDIRVITNGIPTAQTKSIVAAAELAYIEPTEGPMKGGTPIQIYGNGFTDEMTIFFNDVKIPYKLLSTQQLTISSPSDNVVLGNNKIQFISNKFSTNLSTKFVCYPSILNMMQKYDAIHRKMSIWIQGRGLSINTTIGIGKKTDFVTISEKNSLRIDFDEQLKSKGDAEDVYVITNDLKSCDKILYSSVPIVTKVSSNNGVIAGNNQIIIYGSGFDKEDTYVLWNKVSKIKASIVSGNCLKFSTPSHNTSEKVIYCIVSNDIESIPIEFMYCPEIYSLSEKSCNIGEELLCKVYGEGFEYENSEIMVKNNGRCKIKEYINNKIMDIICGPFHICGTYELYVETAGISSQNSVKIEVKPMIVNICNDIGNVNGGKIKMNVIGVNSNTSILLCYKDFQIEFNHILLEKTGKKSSDIEQITLCYDAINEFKNRLVEENKDALSIQVKIRTNEIESMPISWIMKNFETSQNIDHEIITAITMCNTYLSTNAFNQKYQCITPYSDKLVFKISEMMTKIYELPESICNSECQKILLDGLMTLCDKNEQVSDEIVQNMLTHMIQAFINKLWFGNDYEAATLQLQKAFVINCAESTAKNDTYDYYFQERIELNESEWVINAQELSRAICFKILCDGSVEYKYNHMLLDKICEQFEKNIFKRNFLLVNTDGKFNGANCRSSYGNVIELFSCKITSAIENIPCKHSSCIDMDMVKHEFVEGKQADGTYNSLGKQLKSMLLNREMITHMYNFYQKNTFRMAIVNGANDYIPFPFQRGDSLVFKLLIHKTITTKELFAIRELTHYKIACDPDNQNRNSAYDFLLNYDATEIRATNDCYQIILG